MKILLNIIGWIFVISFLLFAGFSIANIFPHFGRIQVIFIYICLYSFYVYLALKAKIPMFDGLSSDNSPLFYSLPYALASTVAILSIASVGKIFLFVSLLIFLGVVIINALVVFQNQDTVPYGTLIDIISVKIDKKLAEKLRKNVKDNPSKKPRSEHLADLTFTIIGTSGIITAVIAYLMYQLDWLIQR